MQFDDLPPMGSLAPIVDEMRDLADEELPEPRTGEIKLWDDGTVSVVIWNRSGDERRQLRYERTTGEILWEYMKGADTEWTSVGNGEAILEPTFEELEVRAVATVGPPS